jgi:hypothetical protein
VFSKLKIIKKEVLVNGLALQVALKIKIMPDRALKICKWLDKME